MICFSCPGGPRRLSPARLPVRSPVACIVVLLALHPGTNDVLSAEAAADGKGVKFFESKIRPVLVR